MGDFVVSGGLYTYEGHTYRVTVYEPDLYQVKNAATGEWEDAVTYVSIEEGHAAGMTFTRAKSDFVSKFEHPVSEEGAGE